LVHSALKSIAHRPWPLPTGPWVMAQTWHDLLFAHWRVAPDVLGRLVPPELPLDTWDGCCWVGVIPFHMSGIHARGLAPLPGLSRFPELNVRTYVTLDGKPGVYFFSLDAASLGAVWAARAFYRLPYFHARMTAEIQQEWVRYDSERYRAPAEFRARYRPLGQLGAGGDAPLARWLAERYCLYTVQAGRVYRAEIHHPSWPLEDAEAEIETNTVASAAGISLPQVSPLLHFARQLEVLIWPLRRIR
jgi:hypothetical protein